MAAQRGTTAPGRRPVNRLGFANAIAIALVVVAVAVAAIPAGATPADASATLLENAALTAEHLRELLERGFERHPAAMLAGVVALAMPVVAVAAALVRLITRLASRRGRSRTADTEGPTTGGRRPPTSAWIEVEGQLAPPLRIGELVRIGRSEDCDLALVDAGLDGMHALIQRTADSEYVIFDVSSDEATGLAVNGEISRRHRLRNGDCIEIGSSRVVFRTSPRGHAAQSALPA